jgi:hypothetical protein
MSTHGLKNHKGKDGWGDGDEFHFELPDSKVPKSDKRVQACLIHYAKITRVDGEKRNTKFESDPNWKAALKEHLQKYEALAEKLKEEAHRNEMKKLRLEGTSKSSESLLRGSNKTGSADGKPFADILPASAFDSGKLTAKKISIGNAMVWDSLARSIFEKLGLSETSGFDVKLSCGVTYEHITYENLSQSFIRNIVPHVVLIYNTPVAKMMAMSVDVAGEIALTKSALTPKGGFIFTFKLTSPIDTEKGRIEIEIDGAKAKASLR